MTSPQPFVALREDDGDFGVWLLPDDSAGNLGICIGAAETKAEALQEARESLAIAAKQLEHLENQP